MFQVQDSQICEDDVRKCTTQHVDKEKNRTASVRKTTCHHLPVFASIKHRISQSVNVVLHDSMLHERSPLNTL